MRRTMSSMSSTTTSITRNVSTKPQMPGVTVSGSNSSSVARTSSGSAAAVTSALRQGAGGHDEHRVPFAAGGLGWIQPRRSRWKEPGVAEPETDTLAARYGRTVRPHARPALLIGAAAAFRGRAHRMGRLGGPRRPEADGRGHRHRPPAHERRARGRGRAGPSRCHPGNETACIVQALDEDFAVVGWKIVEFPASSEHLRTLHRRPCALAREAQHGFDLPLLAHLIL